MKRQGEPGNCQLCGRYRLLDFHHLIPRTCHSNKWFKRQFQREEMKARGLDLCRDCHTYLHTTFDKKHLGRHLNTRADLLADEGVQKFVKWVRKKK